MKVCTACRICGSQRLEIVLDMGELYIADFLEDGQEAHKAPLTLIQCQDCSFVQLLHTVPRDWLYREYWFKSGTNERMVKALQDVVDAALKETPTPRAVLDIGANDGTLLRMFPKETQRIGYEPARNLYDDAIGGGNGICRGFYPDSGGSNEYSQWCRYKADIITSIAMFYDLDDPNAFVAAIKRDLAPDGVWIVQQAYLPFMLATNGIDNISHEHLGYHTIKTMARLVNAHGLKIDKVAYNDVNGGSFRCFIRHGTGGFTGDWNLSFGTFHDFAQRAERNKTATRDLLKELKLQGKQVLGYGASIRGNTILQYYDIGPNLLDAIAECDLRKVGRETAGMNIPIISEEEMRERKPDFLFVLPWHLLDVFIPRERAFLAGGGKFIVPLPNLRIVPEESLPTMGERTV